VAGASLVLTALMGVIPGRASQGKSPLVDQPDLFLADGLGLLLAFIVAVIWMLFGSRRPRRGVSR
jgi:hypothetical protein